MCKLLEFVMMLEFSSQGNQYFKSVYTYCICHKNLHLHLLLKCERVISDYNII